jgi:hypothetical protein
MPSQDACQLLGEDEDLVRGLLDEPFVDALRWQRRSSRATQSLGRSRASLRS